MNQITRIIVVFFVGVIPLTYNACSSSHTGSDSLSSLDACQQKQSTTFQETYYQFAKTNCITCHAPGGVGKGYFAGSDIEVAYKAFSYLGYAMFGERAKDDAHAPPFSGSKHAQSVKDMEQKWGAQAEEFEFCLASGDASLAPIFLPDSELDLRVQTTQKNISANLIGEDSVVVSWDLATEVYTSDGSSLQGVTGTFSVTVIPYIDSGGEYYYHIYRPEVVSTSDIRVESLVFGFNGSYLKTESTFTNIIADVYDSDDRSNNIGVGSEIISGGTLIIKTVPTVNDFLKVTFGVIESTTLVKPPAGPIITFASNTGSVLEGSHLSADPVTRRNDYMGALSEITNVYESVPNNSACVTLNVQTGGENDFISPDEPVRVIIGVIGQGGAKPVGGGPGITAVNVDIGGNQTDVNRYDWDYILGSETVLIYPGEASKEFCLEISKDNRFEEGETVEVTISGIVGGTNGQGNTPMVISIIDDDVDIVTETTVFGEPYQFVNKITYGYLMDPNYPYEPPSDYINVPKGVLYTNCFQCHNSVRRYGNYDLSNYVELLERGVVLPPEVDNTYISSVCNDANVIANNDNVSNSAECITALNSDFSSVDTSSAAFAGLISNSYMYIRTAAKDSTNFDTMPIENGPMNIDNIDAVKQWILTGALDD